MSAYLQGEYGIEDLFVGVQLLLEIVALKRLFNELSKNSQNELAQSVKSARVSSK